MARQTDERPDPPAAGSTPVPHWLIMSGVSPGAIALYAAVKTVADPDNIARIHLTPLARMIGFSRYDKIRRFLRELTVVGALSVLRPASRALGEYLVRDTPPEGYEGPRTVAEWREALRRVDVDAEGEAAA